MSRTAAAFGRSRGARASASAAMRRQELERGGPRAELERVLPAGQHAEDHEPQRVDVARRPGRAAVEDLQRRVRGSAGELARSGQVVGVDVLRDAEVAELHERPPVRGHQVVRRLHVAVRDADRVRAGQAVRRVARDEQRLGQREGRVRERAPLELVVQAGTVHQLHLHPGAVLSERDRVHLHDRLGADALRVRDLGPDAGFQLVGRAPEHLDRHVLAQVAVVHAGDTGEAALAQHLEARDVVAPRELRLAQAALEQGSRSAVVRRCGHGSPPSAAWGRSRAGACSAAGWPPATGGSYERRTGLRRTARAGRG
jgi:hypothetical protein